MPDPEHEDKSMTVSLTELYLLEGKILADKAPQLLTLCFTPSASMLAAAQLDISPPAPAQILSARAYIM